MDNYNIFDYLYKLSNNQAEEVEKESTGSHLPEGYVTDGLGNIYRIPNKGKSPKLNYNGVSMWYDWELKAICTNDTVINKYSLSPSDFIDSPEYWFGVVKNNIDEDGFNVGESFTPNENSAIKDVEIKVTADYNETNPNPFKDVESVSFERFKEDLEGMEFTNKHVNFELIDIESTNDESIFTFKIVCDSEDLMQQVLEELVQGVLDVVIDLSYKYFHGYDFNFETKVL